MSRACGHCGQLHEAYLAVCPVTGARMPQANYTVVNEDEVLLGSVVGERYHLREILGQGSTGTVFGAEHVHFGRGAAMKVLRPRFTGLEVVQRVFHGEARASWTVSHPSLVEVFDIGTLPDGVPFFVMERLYGDPLSTRLGRERFSAAAGVDLLMQMLSAIDAVHSRDLLLRDMRPANLFLLNRRGCRPVLKILDFGLARLTPIDRIREQWEGLRAMSSADGAGAVAIPYYLSPERARDGEHAAMPQSDLFVAAAIFYEMMTAYKPFDAPTFDGLVRQILSSTPQPIRNHRTDIPEDVDALIRRTMSADPRHRPSTAREMQDELRSAFDGVKRGSSSMKATAVMPPQAQLQSLAQDDSIANGPPTRSVASIVHTPIRPQLDSLTLEPGQRAPNAPPSGDSFPLAMGMRAARETIPPSMTRTEPPSQDPDDGFEEETNTDRHHDQLVAAARSIGIDGLDEASADHAVKTMRPPSAVDFDVDVEFDAQRPDPATSRGVDIAEALAHAIRGKGKRANEEDETETMQLTPEIRARIEQMTRGAAPPPPPPPSSKKQSSRPPPTRRLGNKPGR